MTARAVRVLPVLGEFLTDGEVPGSSVLVEGWDVVGRWGWWVVENDFDDPGPAGDRMSTLGTGGHAQHGSVGDYAAIVVVDYAIRVVGDYAAIIGDYAAIVDD